MKRNRPNTTIDFFFSAPKPKPPPLISKLSAESKKQLVVIKSVPQTKIKRIVIPSISSDENIQKEKLSSVLDYVVDSIHILFNNGIDKINCYKVSQNVEYYCRFGSGEDMFMKLEQELKPIKENFLK